MMAYWAPLPLGGRQRYPRWLKEAGLRLRSAAAHCIFSSPSASIVLFFTKEVCAVIWTCVDRRSATCGGLPDCDHATTACRLVHFGPPAWP